MLVDKDQLEIFSPQKELFVYLRSLLIFHISQYSLNQLNHILCLPRDGFLETIIIIDLRQTPWLKNKTKNKTRKNIPAVGHADVFCEMDLGLTQLIHLFPGILLGDLK